jgi:putative MFS transporter
MVYFVGVIPLILLAVARRNLKETRRFAEQVDDSVKNRPFGHIFRTPYRSRVLLLALLWALGYIGASPALFFWKDFAVNERELTDGQVGIALAIAAVASLLLIFGREDLRSVGRKPGLRW